MTGHKKSNTILLFTPSPEHCGRKTVDEWQINRRNANQRHGRKPMVTGFTLLAAALVFVGGACEKKSFTQPAPAQHKAVQPATRQEGTAPQRAGTAMPIVPSGAGQPPAKEMRVEQSGVVEINLDARNFSYSQTELRVQQGDRVKVTINVVQGFHDWVVDEFNARTAQTGEGKTASVEFVADKTGTFEYYCSVGQHRQMGMKGKLVVE